MTRLLARNRFAQPRTATEIVDDVCLAARQLPVQLLRSRDDHGRATTIAAE
jgi:hypothetical protein